MKKTLTVNLGGTVFHIDEDAYQLLDKYLSDLRQHFRKGGDSDEIMNDFELRISELFNEKLRLGYEVITVEHVEEVIKRMGKLEDIFGEEFSEEGDNKEEPKAKAEAGYSKKRLFRSPDDRILGGVAGGFAVYMGWDPTAVRIALILLMFFYGITIPLYLILWLVVPMATTAAEKLQMHGEKVTVENIGKTVTDGFERISNNVNDYINSDKPRSTLQKLGDAFVSVFGICIKIFGVLLAIALFPPLLFVLFILMIVFFALIAGLFGGGFGLLYRLLPAWESVGAYPESWLTVGILAGIVLLAIPAFGLIYALCRNLFKWKPMATGAKWFLIILWIVSLLATIFVVVNYGFPVLYDNGWQLNRIDFHNINLW